MARRAAKPPPPAGLSLRAAFYGAVLVALGFSVGLLAGSLLETPRLLMEWARGPVDRVEVEPVPGVAAGAPAAAPVTDPEPRVWTPRIPPPPARAPAARVAAPETRSPAESAPAARVPDALRDAREAAGRPERAVDVLGDLEREVAGRAAPPSAAAPERLVVQVASTTDAAEAGRLVARLRTEGFDAFSVVLQPADGIRRHRVRVRPAGGVLAGDLADRLRDQGYATWITPDE